MKKVSKYNLVNFSNSFLKHYGVDTFHESIPELDEILKGHKKIVFMLFDGMGQAIIRKHLADDDYMRKHYCFTIDSTFPPTTAAATTAVLSGRYPIETGWTAWDAYFKDLNRNVILFMNIDYNTEDKLTSKPVREILEYDSICDLINKKDPSNNAMLMQRFPIQQDGPRELSDSYEVLTNKLKNNKKCFIYYYFDSPDKEMHECGVDAPVVHEFCKDINAFVEKITKENPDTLFITYADHGQLNVKYFNICDYPKLTSMLSRPVGGEKRSTWFWVKPEYLNEFKRMFMDIYGNHFDLLSKQEVLEQKLYGEGIPHPLFNDMLGDYLAISKDEYSLLATNDFARLELLKGHHAGGSLDELLIDVSVYNK
mgnify:CR=1 FL=1